MQGRIIFTSQEINMNAGIANQINLSNVDSSLYFVKMKTANEQHVQRISVIR